MDFHVYHHFVTAPDPRIDEVLSLLHKVLNKENIIMSDVSNLGSEIDALTAQVEASETVTSSAVTLIEGFAAQLQAAIDAATAAGATPEQIASLVALGDSLSTSTDALAAAVAAAPASS